MRSMTPPRLIKDTWTSRAGRWLATLLLALAITLVSAPLMAPPAHATGDTLTLSIDNGTTFIYGQSPVPTFSAVVTFGVKPTANYFWMVTIKLDDGESFGNQFAGISSSDGMTLTFTRITSPTPIHADQHTASASFYDPGTGTTATSNPVPFTMNKATLSIACSVNQTDPNFFGVSQPLRIQVTPFSGGGELPAEWHNGTFTVTFDGPTHVSNSNLIADASFNVAVTSPSKNGRYTLTCSFSGTASYNAVSFTDNRPVIDSMMNPLGSAQLFTNPTTLTASVNTDFYLVLHAASGLPTPNGEFQILLGPWYTKAIPLTSAGDCQILVRAPPSLSGVNQITIVYWGDINYNKANINFPLTNPPIPSGGGGGGGGNGQATATAKATGIADATATMGGDAATPTAAGAGGVLTATPPGGDNNGLLLIVVLAVLGMLVALGGAAALVIYVARRRKALAPIGPGGFDPRPSGYAPRYGIAYGDPYPMPPHQQASQSPEPPMPSVDD
ncbi:MAG TPA: hypothetical protein VFN11_11100 [Ktedonobacterales bacterium]|nr:hypothetical protein [Ktedonobacterales bacterium]